MSESGASTTSAAPYIFYGDLNCPFCHAQNERLVELCPEGKIEWRGVRRMPDLPVPARNSAPEREEMLREVVTLRKREPGLSVSVPPARPNTERATLLVAAARKVDLRGAETLKTLLYRALWLHGRDISDTATLDELRRVASLPEIVVGDAERKLLGQWQKEWEEGGFDRRIPVIVSPRGARLLGLSERGRVEVFLRSGLLNAEGGGYCD
jgi:2-hydroxychromene-2-carboxylate isomerase